MTSSPLQLDLFGEVLGTEQRRQVDALTCLRDAMDDTLAVVVALNYQRPQDTHVPLARGDWAYCVCRAGIRVEAVSEWWAGGPERREPKGWNRTPAALVTWDELTALISRDPRRAEVAAWVDGLPLPRWRQLMRPKELGPNPDGWNLGYICRDHIDRNWTQRRYAWQLVLDLLSDAIAAITGEEVTAA